MNNAVPDRFLNVNWEDCQKQNLMNKLNIISVTDSCSGLNVSGVRMSYELKLFEIRYLANNVF